MQISPNSLFTTFILTEKEIQQGSVFTGLQKAVIQNLIASAASDKVRLKFTPDNLNLFLQAEAELQGRISALEGLLIMSEDTESQLSPHLNGEG